LLLAGSLLLLFGFAFPPGVAGAGAVLAATRPYVLVASLPLALATIAMFVSAKPWRYPPSSTSIFQALFAVLAIVAWCYALLYTTPF
jgi:hypothetical protein